ncbi:MAG: hypothetical protein ACREPM_16050, partial [Gemmatimonadaceae bacterium]
MRLRSAVVLWALGISAPGGHLAAQVTAASQTSQAWAVDQGTFVVLKGGAPALTESFKITRKATGLITATGNQTAGVETTTSSLTTDSLGTPVQYELQVRKQGALSLKVTGAAAARRFTTRSSAGGVESMREYPLAAGRSLILEPSLLHQFYFLPLPGRDTRIHVLQPGVSRVANNVVVTSKGLDNISV